MQAPDRDRHHQPRVLGECWRAFDGFVIGVLTAKPAEAELQRERAERIASAGGLLDHADLAQAHQIGVELGGRNADGIGEVTQHHRRRGRGERAQDDTAGLQGLNAALRLGRIGLFSDLIHWRQTCAGLRCSRR